MLSDLSNKAFTAFRLYSPRPLLQLHNLSVTWTHLSTVRKSFPSVICHLPMVNVFNILSFTFRLDGLHTHVMYIVTPIQPWPHCIGLPWCLFLRPLLSSVQPLVTVIPLSSPCFHGFESLHMSEILVFLSISASVVERIDPADVLGSTWEHETYRKTRWHVS